MCTEIELAALTRALGKADLATSLCDKFAAQEELSAKLGDAVSGLNIQYLIWAGALVFIMHGGFAMVGFQMFKDASACWI